MTDLVCIGNFKMKIAPNGVKFFYPLNLGKHKGDFPISELLLYVEYITPVRKNKSTFGWIRANDPDGSSFYFTTDGTIELQEDLESGTARLMVGIVGGRQCAHEYYFRWYPYSVYAVHLDSMFLVPLQLVGYYHE